MHGLAPCGPDDHYMHRDLRVRRRPRLLLPADRRRKPRRTWTSTTRPRLTSPPAASQAALQQAQQLLGPAPAPESFALLELPFAELLLSIEETHTSSSIAVLGHCRIDKLLVDLTLPFKTGNRVNGLPLRQLQYLCSTSVKRGYLVNPPIVRVSNTFEQAN